MSTPITRAGKASKIAAVSALAAVVCLVAVATSDATFRGTNGLLVYQAKVGKHIQLFTIRADGSNTRRLTNFKDSDAVEASWSADGKRIAFARDYAVGTRREHLDIVTMNADGSGLRAMGLRGLNGAPTWSPSGRIAWLRAPGLAVGMAGRKGFTTIRLDGENGTPTFSPNGKRIAFRRQLGDRKSAIFVVRADGSHARRVIAPAGGVADKIDWSPDGSRIVFSAPEFGSPGKPSSNVFTVRPGGGGLRQLTHSRGGKVNNGADSWSPDGKKIAFVSNRGGTYQIYTMNADGTGVARLTHGSEAHLAAWGSHS